MPSETTKCLGLDFGSTQAAVVYLRLVNGKPLLRRAVCLDMQTEGLLNEQELRQSVREWLQHRKLLALPVACGLPAARTSSTVLSFPASHSDDDVQKIVQFQTRQLCGLTDEPFCSDTQRLDSNENDSRSVILSACRQRTAEEVCQHLNNLGLEIRGLTDNAQAVANTFDYFHQDESRSDSLQLLLDIGLNDTTVVLWQNGNPLFTGTLPFGGTQFTRRLAALLNCNEETAEKCKFEADESWLDPDSPQNQVIVAFAREIHNLFTLFPESVVDKNGGLQKPYKIWLTGGGAMLPGLDRTLSRELQCPVTIFGVTEQFLSSNREDYGCPEGFDCNPRLTTAFGLALQGLGLSRLNLSLLPERFRWKQKKMHELPFLFAACVLFLTVIFLSSGLFLLNLRQKVQDAVKRKETLAHCLVLIPKLNQAYEEIDFRQRQILPIAEYGLRSTRYCEAISSCREVFAPEVMQLSASCLYLADEFTFVSEFPSAAKPMAKPDAAPLAPRPGVLEKPVSVFPATPPAPAVQEELPICVDDFPILRSMYLGGLVGADDEHYLAVKEIQTKFHERSSFSNVDDCIDSVRIYDDNHFFPSWLEFCQNNAEKLENAYSIFLLSMPFSNNLVNSAPAAASPDVQP